MKGTLIGPTRKWELDAPPDGEFLMLVEPERVPPHLALLSEGEYYSLSIKGVEVGKNGLTVLGGLLRKGKACLLIGLAHPDSEVSPARTFKAYEGSGPPEVSCLRPLIDRYGLDPSRIRTVHDLIDDLDRYQRLASPHYRIGMGTEKDTYVTIPSYGEKDVQAHLATYKNSSSKRL